MEKFQEVFDNWAKVNKELYQESKNYLKGVLENVEDNYIAIESDNQPTVSYDGGRHPEYAANPFSCVSSVYLKDNKIYIDIEDEDEYDIDRLDAYDLYNVADAVENILLGECNE